MKRKTCFYAILGATLSLAACSDDDMKGDNLSPETPIELPEWYYTGGELGTTSNSTSTAFEDPTAVVEVDVAMNAAFNRGEQFFEKPFTANFDGMRHGRSTSEHRAYIAILAMDTARVRTTARSTPMR